VNMEVGHAARNVYLKAVSLGLETVVVGLSMMLKWGGCCSWLVMSGGCALCLRRGVEFWVNGKMWICYLFPLYLE